jgi:hypothetical protein
MRKTAWFSAKGLFRHGSLSKRSGKQVYEERIVLFRAGDFHEAIALADAEARQYAADLEAAEYLGYVDVYELEPDSLGHEAEVYSLMRSTELNPEEFITRYHADGTQRSQRESGLG